MIYLLALIGLVAVIVLFWKAFGPSTRPATTTHTVGPDDDPDFLWRMNRDVRRGRQGGTEAGTEPSE